MAPDAVSRFERGEPETVAAVRRLILVILRTHSRELRPYWDDLVLEACTQAWLQVRNGAERIKNLEGLVARIAHARVIDLHRHRSRWRLESGIDERPTSIAERDLGPYETVLRSEKAHLASVIVGAADERTRAIWRLIFFEGLKYREAAERLGMPEGTLKRLVHESLRTAARRFAWLRSAVAGVNGTEAKRE